MRQVPRYAGRPVKHLLIGNGRLSRHLANYLTLLDLPFETWLKPRALSRELFMRTGFTHIWFLVSDSAIESVVQDYATGVKEFSSLEVDTSGEKFEPLYLHASGALVTSLARGAHPLMTFGAELYSKDAYSRIPFVIEATFDGVEPSAVLGGMPNIAVTLPAEKRPLYHALVVESGNFPAMLWAKVFEKFETDLGLERNLLAPYLFQTLANVLREGDASLTGPLVRGDRATVLKHQRELAESPLGELYAAFAKFFQQSFTHSTRDEKPPRGGHHV